MRTIKIVKDSELEVEIIKVMNSPISVWSNEGTTLEYRSREVATQVALYNITKVWFEKDMVESWLKGVYSVRIDNVSFFSENAKGKMF